MADWLYTLKIKDLFNGDGTAETTFQAAPQIEAAIRQLMVRVQNTKGQKYVDRQGDLYMELDEVADLFGDIAKRHESIMDDPVRHFDGALGMLYDLGDDGHRVWVS